MDLLHHLCVLVVFASAIHQATSISCYSCKKTDAIDCSDKKGYQVKCKDDQKYCYYSRSPIADGSQVETDCWPHLLPQTSAREDGSIKYTCRTDLCNTGDLTASGERNGSSDADGVRATIGITFLVLIIRSLFVFWFQTSLSTYSEVGRVAEL